jgi:hypothetical protein
MGDFPSAQACWFSFEIDTKGGKMLKVFHVEKPIIAVLSPVLSLPW